MQTTTTGRMRGSLSRLDQWPCSKGYGDEPRHTESALDQGANSIDRHGRW